MLGCHAISLGNPFISTNHWLHLKFWGRYLATGDLQFCFLLICDREEDDQIWDTNWVEMLAVSLD